MSTGYFIFAICSLNFSSTRDTPTLIINYFNEMIGNTQTYFFSDLRRTSRNHNMHSTK